MAENALARYSSAYPLNALAQPYFGGIRSSIDEYAGPQLPVGASDYVLNPPARPPIGDGSVLTQGYDRVLPSHNFLDRYVSTSPTVHDQIGRMQSAGLAALDSLGFGLPMAAAHRLAPDAARRVQAVIDAYPNEKAVAGIGAAVANPANAGLRAGGNALAAKGYNVGFQAAADGATALGVSSAADVLKNGGLPNGADIPATTASVARFMMPTVPSSLIERTLRGAQAGAYGQAPMAALNGDYNRLGTGATYGAAHGAGLKSGRNEPRLSPEAQREVREKYVDWLWPMVAAPGALHVASSMKSKMGRDESPAEPQGDRVPRFDAQLTDILSKYGLMAASPPRQ